MTTLLPRTNHPQALPHLDRKKQEPAHGNFQTCSIEDAAESSGRFFSPDSVETIFRIPEKHLPHRNHPVPFARSMIGSSDAAVVPCCGTTAMDLCSAAIRQQVDIVFRMNTDHQNMLLKQVTPQSWQLVDVNPMTAPKIKDGPQGHWRTLDIATALKLCILSVVQQQNILFRTCYFFGQVPRKGAGDGSSRRVLFHLTVAIKERRIIIASPDECLTGATQTLQTILAPETWCQRHLVVQ